MKIKKPQFKPNFFLLMHESFLLNFVCTVVSYSLKPCQTRIRVATLAFDRQVSYRHSSLTLIDSRQLWTVSNFDMKFHYTCALKSSQLSHNSCRETVERTLMQTLIELLSRDSRENSHANSHTTLVERTLMQILAFQLSSTFLWTGLILLLHAYAAGVSPKKWMPIDRTKISSQLERASQN
jgi:hypothetical protein